ncbi:Universal stress protein UspA and related nucleotide-binding proteins [Enterobacter hormaechei]|uniref:universal stress protein n=1 Tax=Enterobacter hormaechei TaxID=158836 RepID=UPI00079700F6|nr:universal stress protein [Enterobacter hormaechei]SAH27663.1 Universal stress protein UspA and related nucleotide-binding proteins [Enterobacter hormaechei]
MYKTILVPVDVYETALSDKALQHAQFLAQSASGDVHLLYVMPKFSAELTRGFIADARKMDEYMINNAKEKLAALVKKINLPEANVHLHVRSGNIRDEVIKLADELNVGAIIVGSRNPNIQTHLLGSEAASTERSPHNFPKA